MKKKLLLSFVLAIVFALTLTVVAFADSIHNENTVDYNEKAILADGTVLPIYDENKEALIWYISGKDENGNNIYTSIRSDDPQVIYHCETWFEITSTRIDLSDGTKISSSDFVVVNWMDDDVVVNECSKADYIGKAVTGFKLMFQGNKNLQYIYLRHDTTSIMRQNFNGCSNLRYVNFKDLTMVTRIGDSQHFSNCGELFKGEILDLSNMTSLTRIDGGGTFNNVHFAKIILPSSLKEIASWSFQATSFESFIWPSSVTKMEGSMFKNNTGLKEIYLPNTLTSIGGDAFLNVNTLEKIFFVGTKDEFTTLLSNVNSSGNAPFFSVANEGTAISYADYKKLEDKSGKYLVYDVSTCAYGGEHGEINLVNPCVGACSICGERMVKHAASENISVNVEYSSFALAGTKTVICNNEGCGHEETSELSALLVCRGYSAPENEDGRFAIVFDFNSAAITEYKALTGKEVKLGVFAVLQSKLGANDILGTDGKLTCDGVKAEVEYGQYTSVELKLSGFETDEHKALALAMGAYVDVDGEYSYIQAFAPEANAKYSFVTYNDVVKPSVEDAE